MGAKLQPRRWGGGWGVGLVLLSLCLQEMATVSAVSLTANEFPVGGVAAAHVCACVDGCLDMCWGGSTAAWK